MRRDLKKTKNADEARNESFKGRTIYLCKLCKTHYYTGQSEKNFIKLKESEFPDLIRCKSSQFHLDHVDPVVPIETNLHSMSLDEIAHRTYFGELQYICESCHKAKSKKEVEERTKAGSLKRKK